MKMILAKHEMLNTFQKKRRNKMIRYYWEALFSVEYFPYWEFTMLMVLTLQLSQIWRLHRMESKIDDLVDDITDGIN